MKTQQTGKMALAEISEIPAPRSSDYYDNFLRHSRQSWIDDLVVKPTSSGGKKSFLVSRGNKYINVPTDNIAIFFIKHEATRIMCFDKQLYCVDYTLDHLQSVLPAQQFYRLNRQYLINFGAVREVEHYFARKLLVHALVSTDDKLVVSKEKVTEFLKWLDNR